MLKIIAHRCAAGLAPENSLLGIEKAIVAGADYVECDVRSTKDKVLVLCHDDTLLRISGNPVKVNGIRMTEISTTITHGGEPIPTLKEALETAGKIPLIIDGKGSDWAEPLAKVLQKHKGPMPKVISYNPRELFAFNQLMPAAEVYVIEDTHPIEALSVARKLGLSGVSLASWLYSPWVYWLARHSNLKLISSPMNRKWIVRFFHAFYPHVMITTDYPDRFKHRKKH